MQTYTVVKGDSLWLIAKKFGVTLEDLIRANPQIKDPNKIFPGQKINIPLPTQGGNQIYVVQPGDTMWLIARKFGISLEALLQANPQITDADRINIGERIIIPQGSGSGSSDGTGVYIVQSGDTMWLIAQRFGISLDELIRMNPQIKDPNLIHPGQKINVPGKPGSGTYTVVSGDTMWSIAKRCGISLNELIRMNPQIKDPNVIYPGQKINVPRSCASQPAPPTPPTPPAPAPTGENNGKLYFVKSGDTFFNIAQRFALNLDSLIRANPQIKNPDRIDIGMQLYLPGHHYVRSGETLHSIARNYGVSLSQLIAVNPQIQDPNRIDVGQKIAIPRRDNGDMAIYTVKSGDTLYKIAKKYNLTVEALVNANPTIKNPDQIFPGEVLRIPGPHQVQKGQTLAEIAALYRVSLEALIRANPQIQNPNVIFPDTMVIIPPARVNREERGDCGGIIYVVQPGDTLFEIAGMYNVALERLIEANSHIQNPDLIFPGQKIRIPIGHSECTCYLVKAGDTLTKIARMYRVTVEAIMKNNPQIQNPNHIEIGWVLMIPLRGSGCLRDEVDDYDVEEEERAAITRPQRYVVAPGDSLYKIANKFGVTVAQIMAANPCIADENIIQPGEVLVILPAEMANDLM